MIFFNFFLALIWVALQDSFTLADFIVGFVMGFIAIALTQRALRREGQQLELARGSATRGNYVVWFWHWIAFIGFSLWEIVKANLAVSRIVLSPQMNVRPGIVAVPLDIKSEAGITVLANLITLTPGTVSMDVSTDKKTIYIHTLNVDNPDELRREIKEVFERRVMELLP